MIPHHRIIYSEKVHGTVLMAKAKTLPHMDEVMLPMGRSFSQGFSNKCASHAVWNVLETCDAWLDEPLPTVDSMYELGRELADQKKHHWGSFPAFVAEAACRKLGGAANWMELPARDIDLLAAWLTVEQTGILIGMDWTAGHNVSRWGKNNILFPSGGTVGPGHAFNLIGMQRARSYREGLLGLRKKSVPVAAIENTHWNTDEIYYLQLKELEQRADTAIVFIPPKYTPV
jgi:hypothetical protein